MSDLPDPNRPSGITIMPCRTTKPYIVIYPDGTESEETSKIFGGKPKKGDYHEISSTTYKIGKLVKSGKQTKVYLSED